MKILIGYLSEEYLKHDRKRFDARYAPRDRSGHLFPLSIAEMLESCPPGWVPDVFLHPGIGHFPLPSDIEEFSGLSVCAIGDWDRRGRATRAGIGFFDLTMGQRELLPILRAEGYENAEFVRLWYTEPEKQFVIPDIERDIDILFVGSLNPLIWRKREKWLEQIALLSDQYKVKIEYGVFGKEYNCLLNRAKIVFNCSAYGETNARVYEAAACGALLFNEAENTENAEILEDGVHHVLYTQENYRERLAYFLASENEKERLKIAEAGRVRVVTRHTMRSHTDAMFGAIETHLGERTRPFLQLPLWKQFYRKAQQVFGCLSPDYFAYCRRLLRDAQRAGCPPELFHEAQATLFAWEAENGSDPVGLLSAAQEQAKRAFAVMPTNLYVRMTYAGICLARSNETGMAEQVLSETIRLCEALLSGQSALDFSMIEGFGFPRTLDGFDFSNGRAEMSFYSRPEASAETILRNFGGRCATMLFDLALREGDLPKAILHGQTALRLKSDAPLFRLRLAECFAQTGNWAEAAKAFRAIEEVPFAIEHWISAILAYRNAGLETEANAYLAERLKIVDAMPGLSGMKPELKALQVVESTEKGILE